jgi:UDP-N-acetylglucosamine diphosphorylase/glucosamine-1-phosphate N-acetyltransferase
LWDIIDWNGEYLVNDLQMLDKGGQINGIVSPGVHLIEKESIFISKTAQLKPGVVVDASEGPVWIEEGVTVMPNATLEGPIYIGKNSLIKVGAKLYGNTTIGPVCKIGGEVEGCIVQGYSNKQHDGFLGHSYLGSWANLGADTNNSDLKNNYGKIQVLLNGRLMDTGKQFLGLIMGDHSKTAINTMFNTGTIVGVNCNIFGAGMPPRFVPSFSWGGADKLVEYRLDKIIEVAKIVMGRRKITFTDKDEQLFLEVKKLAKQVEKVANR